MNAPIYDMDLNKDTNRMSFTKDGNVEVESNIISPSEENDEFYKDKVMDKYYSKNGMWQIEHANGEYVVMLKGNNGAWITVASYTTRNCGKDIVEDCKRYVRYVCKLN